MFGVGRNGNKNKSSRIDIIPHLGNTFTSCDKEFGDSRALFSQLRVCPALIALPLAYSNVNLAGHLNA